MAALVVYGDFNCPFSALASLRVDLLLAAGSHEVDWRAVQHDSAIPDAGEPVVGETAADLSSEVDGILELLRGDERLHLVVPPVRPNTAEASAAFAAAGRDRNRLRRELFAALWSQGQDIGRTEELERVGAVGRDAVTANRWQAEFDALPRPVTPTLVLPDGYVSRGLGALVRLADLAALPSA
jgi:predicted DsbA family dithiol-disulfide isomerase